MVTERGPAQAYRGSIEKLIARIDETRGIDLGLYRRSYLERRIAARLRAVGMHSYRQYSDLLESDPGEFDRLIATLTINVTEFFRDKTTWDALQRRVLSDLIERKRANKARSLRVWSAGCATGEEPYSIAMLLLDMLGPTGRTTMVSVTATDLDPDALSRAERGVYEASKLRRISPNYQVRFTRNVDKTHFEVVPEVRRLVRFQRRSLFEPSPFRSVDLIMCRNVFIYFDRDQQLRALDNFWDALSAGGHLVLGRSEKLQPAAAERFAIVDGRERIYRKPARR